MSVFKGLLGMKPLRPSLTDRNLYQAVPEADLEAKLEHMKQIPKENEAPAGTPPTSPLPEGSRVLGLRVESWTHEGLREGLPRLLDALASRRTAATVYVAMGPDRSGVAALRLMRSGARQAYSVRTLLAGLLLPARPTAAGAGDILRRVQASGHELGILRWDCRAWERSLNRRGSGWGADQLERAFEAFASVVGCRPVTASAPGWLCNNDSLLYQENLSLRFASDCRGTDPFLPVLDVRVLKTPQVPVTLPTLEEALTARTHGDAQSFFSEIPKTVAPGEWPVLSLSADVEGRLWPGAVAEFLDRCAGEGIRLAPLGSLLDFRLATGRPLPRCTLSYAAVDGRPGTVAMQMFEV